MNQLLFASLFFLLGVLTSCGLRGPEGAKAGALRFDLQFSDNDLLYATNEIPTGVEALVMTVFDKDYNVMVAADGSSLSQLFSRSADYMLLENVPEGNDLIVRIDGVKANSVVTHRGERSGVKIIANTIVNLGTVTLENLETTESISDSTSTATSATIDSFEGSGADDDPIQISSAAELVALGTVFCSSSSSSGCGFYYKLTADIDLSAAGSFTMIGDHGDGTSTTPFNGTFDGGGHVIASPTLATTSSTSGVGLFAHVGSSGVVKNLTVTGVAVVGAEKVGGLVGFLEGRLENVSVSGTVAAKTSVGGLVGKMNSSASITSGSSSASVDASSSEVGGLVGTMAGGSIASSSATGAVTGSANKAGGLVGEISADAASTIDGSSAEGDVTGATYAGGLIGHTNGLLTLTGSHATGSVTGADLTELALGGLVGKMAGDAISKSYATGNVSGTGLFVSESNSGVGGLVGYAKGSGNSFLNCFATGNVSGASGSPGGGLVGHFADGSITNSYATGQVSSSSKKGGLTGLFEGGTLTANFWDTSVSGQSEAYDGSGGSVSGMTSKTTAEMQTESTFTAVGWDFSTVWQISTDSYPSLR